MHSKTLALLALSATAAVASPHMIHRRFHYKGTGTAIGVAIPTGGPYHRNGTANSTVSDFGDIPVVTRTVYPLSAEETGAATSAPVAFEGNANLLETEVAPVGGSTTSTCLSTRTEYATSFEYVTVMATGSGAVVPTGASTESDAFSIQTTTVPSSIKTGSASLSTSGSVNAGEFFGVGSNTRTWGSGASSGSPAVSSAASSAVPTTLATMTSSSKAGASGTSAASSASSPSSSSAPGVSGGKKGISYNTASLVGLFSGVSWSYNWASSADGTPGVEFVPMCWGLPSLGSWASDAASAISSGAKAVLSFNEPDLGTQANMDAATAASKHIEAMKDLKGEVAIGSPAITNGAGTSPLMGIDWLEEWFTQCGGECPVDFVAFHWYAEASLIDYFKQHVNDVISAAKANGVSKVWLTEFGAEGSLEAQASFLAEALPFLESTPEVERYAYFMASEGRLLTGGALNAAGQAYVA